MKEDEKRKMPRVGGKGRCSYIHARGIESYRREGEEKERILYLVSFIISRAAKRASLAQAAATIYTHADEQAPDKM